MFRDIRKKKNIISNEELIDLLINARIGILALNGDDNYPYAIPINYYYDKENDMIFFHGARVGYKIDAIKKCDKACFTIYGDEIIKEESWAPFVKSVVAFGRCSIINDEDEALKAIRSLAMKYYPSYELANEEIEKGFKNVCMFKIKIEHKSGKVVQEK